MESVERGCFRPFSGQSCAVCLASITRPLQPLLCRLVSALLPPVPAAFSESWGFLLVSVHHSMSARTPVLTSMFHSSCVTPPTHPASIPVAPARQGFVRPFSAPPSENSAVAFPGASSLLLHQESSVPPISTSSCSCTPKQQCSGLIWG